MDFNRIKSRENPLVKLVVSLQNSSKERYENGIFVIEGLRICDDAFCNNVRFLKLIVSNTAFEKYPEEIKKFAENSDECYLFTDELFVKISDTKSPQGIIALAEIPDFQNIKLKSGGRYIALENISDPSNLGAVARTAEALGVDGIIVSDNGCDIYSPKVLRASMGTLLRIPVIVTGDIIKTLKSAGIKAYSCVVDKNAESISEITFADGCAVIIGNEANGITEETKKQSDRLITIKMTGRAESLNAASAASIAIWEMMK